MLLCCQVGYYCCFYLTCLHFLTTYLEFECGYLRAQGIVDIEFIQFLKEFLVIPETETFDIQ